MTKLYRTLAAAVFGIIVSMAILGWIGDYDYCEQVILHMSQEQYDSVKNHLTQLNGHSPSDRDIAHYWIDHRDE